MDRPVSRQPYAVVLGRAYECRRIEDELCDFGPGGLTSGRSPDRMDALVWALTELMLREKKEPRVRML